MVPTLARLAVVAKLRRPAFYRKPQSCMQSSRQFDRSATMWIVCLLSTWLLGCAGLRHKNPVSDAVMACREFSRQGVSAMECGEWNQAEHLLRRAVASSPEEADTHRHLAETLWQQGQQREALSHMQKAAELDPTSAEVATRLGVMLLAQGQPTLAAKQAERALEIDSRMPSAWALRGRVARHQQDLSQAMADLHLALQYEPAARDVLLELAALHRQAKRPHREMTTLHRLRETYVPGEEPTDLLTREAEVYLALGRPHNAAERLRLVCDRPDPTASQLCLLAEAEAAIGDPAGALAAAQRALEVDSSSEPAQQLLAKLGGPKRR